MADLDLRRRARRGVLWGVGVLGLGGLTALLAAGAPSGAGALSLVLRPDHSVLSAPKGSDPAAVGWESSNWSGYAETSSAPYTSVSGQWTVPTVTGPNGSYSAAWIGIDGFTNDSLIQTGTEQDYSGGSGRYSAWWTTSSQNFAEQTITTGCTSNAAQQSGVTSDAAATRSVTTLAAAREAPSRTSAPSASTGSASNVTSSGATLNGTVNPNGTATYYYFEYGTSPGYGATTAEVYAGSGKSAIAVSANLTGLSASTTYYFQLVAFNVRFTAYGGGSSFATSANSGSSGGSSCGTVAPGDVMTATISDTSPSTSTWTITIADTSSSHGWTFTKTVTYTGAGASAEWILEAPSLCNGSRCTVATLANYGSTDFDLGTVNNDANPDLTASESGEIVNSRGQVLSIPSAPDSDTDGFAMAYGSTAPSPPSS